MGVLADLKSFGVSPERGFLPDPDPASELLREFADWQDIAADLPRLIPSGRLRPLIAKLPVRDTGGIEDGPLLRRAMQVLSYLGHAYVWGEDPPARAIPPGVAVPWAAVAKRLRRPPVLSYASYVLDNWRRFDPEGPIAIGNISLLQNFLGGADEEWFIAVHVEIEAKAAPVLCALSPLLDAVAQEDSPTASRELERVASGLEQLSAVLQRMPEFCDPYIYYRRVRPYIHGWLDHPALPGGVVYEGVERFEGRGQHFRGETGAQSGIVPVLDALLGIRHADDPLRAYLMEMRDYMPPGHLALVEAVEARPDLRAFVQPRAEAEPELAQAYDDCVHWLAAFRATHLDYAVRYIQRQSPGSETNPTGVGTGGTPFLRYLRKHRDETAEHRLRTRT